MLNLIVKKNAIEAMSGVKQGARTAIDQHWKLIPFDTGPRCVSGAGRGWDWDSGEA